MKIAIIGFDTEGRSTYSYFSQQGGHDITICDQKTDLALPTDVNSVLGEGYLEDLGRFDLIIRTAGMHPNKILDKNPTVAAKVSTHINEFFKASPTRNIIGVTGTKGKGTTSTLIAQMLDRSGKTVRLGGNIGVAALSFIHDLDADSWVVLELSSFQLIDLQHSPHVAVCLMVAPEHLDWHTDLNEYLTAKEQLFARQVNGDVAIYYHDNTTSRQIASAGQSQKIPYYHAPGAEIIDGSIVIDGESICSTGELKLLGQHNWQNACAAVTAVWYAALEVCGPSNRPDVASIRQVLLSFAGLPYRIEFIREVNNISYYNDSFASAPPAPIAAIEAIDQKKVVILGGFDRGLNLSALADGLLQNQKSLRAILVIGEAKNRIITELSSKGVENVIASDAKNMDGIVAQATSLASNGDAVILSPGFPSFDMFKNFEDRGQQFNASVRSL